MFKTSSNYRRYRSTKPINANWKNCSELAIKYYQIMYIEPEDLC